MVFHHMHGTLEVFFSLNNLTYLCSTLLFKGGRYPPPLSANSKLLSLNKAHSKHLSGSQQTRESLPW